MSKLKFPRGVPRGFSVEHVTVRRRRARRMTAREIEWFSVAIECDCPGTRAPNNPGFGPCKKVLVRGKWRCIYAVVGDFVRTTLKGRK